MLKAFIAEEYANLKGRTRRGARAEATFKWHARVRADKKADLKQRWAAQGLEARLQRKQERRKTKLEEQKRRLRDLVSKAVPSQVIPELHA